ncbi:hypothetical protein DSM106972_033760 [Dulcicalothrix desertica PCC 7102]|uniref:Pierisin-like domain-containing protein n=1 Tax=Dulcicalothrix desertica PCC 7102 TaxID=232991 RepID=A0A3S1CLP1_9CYAN|nr:enterotoxin A family protein [Dulcicalothrix desertica]RUT06170.1 hypothetical protein DSM106972_033760 [Dulcicalothrix desertica PCC 7102]
MARIRNFTFRGDSRPPEEIFNTGFQPWNPSGNLTLQQHVDLFDETTGAPIDIRDSQWISTSYSASVAKGFANQNFEGGYVYSLRPEVGLDVNLTLVRNSPESEFAVLGGIQSKNILGARKVDEYDKFVGDFILNPNFVR